jgi:hypothetical protein
VMKGASRWLEARAAPERMSAMALATTGSLIRGVIAVPSLVR